MVELSEVEDRLASMFQVVGRQVPEEPVSGPAPLARLELRSGGQAEAASAASCGGAIVSSPRSTRWRRRGAGVGVVVTTLAIGTGVAAATGWLSPAAVRHNVHVALGPASSIVGSVDPGAVPGAVLRVSMAGPDGAVLNVTSDSGHAGDLAAATCVTLTVTTASGGPVPGARLVDKGGCGMVVAESLGPPLASSALGGGLQTRSTWLAPSGRGYEVEGRVRLWAGPAGGRDLKVEGRVGIYHRELERVMSALSGESEARTLERYTSLGYLDADDIDPAALEDMAAQVRRKMSWAAQIDCLDKVLDAMHHKGNGGWRAGLEPVALQLAGRGEEAAASLKHIVLATWKDDCRTDTKTEAEAFVQRLNETYDPIYKEQANLLVADLVAAGAEVSTLSELRDKAGADDRAVSVLGRWLATSGYLPLKRDLACLLGSPWAEPNAAAFLVDEFRRRSEDDPRKRTLLISIAEAFSRVVDESSVDDAVSIATGPAFGRYRRPFAEAVGKIAVEVPRLVPVLLRLVDDPEAVAPAVVEAVSTLDLAQALPAVEKLVGHPHLGVYQAAMSAVGHLRWLAGEKGPPAGR